VGGIRAVIYIRVSTDEQTRGNGPEAQREECDKHLARCSYELIEVVEDLAISGAKPIDQRPGLARAVALCVSGEADVIVAYAQDRFSRSSAVWETLVSIARASGFRLEAAREGVDLSGEEYEIPADVLAMVAALERKLIARRLRGGRKQRARHDGRGSSYVPFGYRRAGDEVVVDPPAAKIVRRLLTLRSQGKTYACVAATLNGAGLKAPKGGDWTPGQVAWIERRRDLYATGRRCWDGIEAATPWPVILDKGRISGQA
jgi:site-specific DNA recombinase